MGGGVRKLSFSKWSHHLVISKILKKLYGSLMKMLKQLMKDLGLSEFQACQILFGHVSKKKAGRRNIYFKLDLCTRIKTIMNKRKGRSLTEAIAIFHRKDFKKFQQEWNVGGREVVKNLTEGRIRKIVNEVQNTALDQRGIIGLLNTDSFIIPKKK